MYTLQKIISRKIYQIIGIMVAVILVIVLYLEITNEKRLAQENATRTFLQMEQILEKNQRELEEIQEEYRQTCLHNAETIARIIEGDPDVLDSVEELKKIAASVEVDEIHIFDKTGRIYAGTHPQYYDFTFDSGEQIMFFKPMLKDKTLKLVQDITPNTAEGKQMQYSALWNNDGEFIVQVGMDPVNVIKATEKNELSYIFSLLRVNPEINYYAIDAKTGTIVGSADSESTGKNLTEIGLNMEDIADGEQGFYTKIDGQNSFCVFKKIGSNYIGRVALCKNLYQRIPTSMLIFFLCFAALALFLANIVIRHMDKYVVDKIYEINKKLKAITNGRVEETVDIQSSVEFAELSEYINVMVKSLLNNNKKMSYVLSKTNLYIGVYEYNEHMEKIRFTDYIPKVLSIDIEKMERLSSDVKKFREFIDKICENPVPDDKGVYKVGEKYVRIEEIRDEDSCFGVVVDITAEIMRLREIAAERDMDLLTGLYNRRGLDARLSALFSSPQKLGYSAVVMIDADRLKHINDTYGHEVGDVYLQKLSDLIRHIGTKKSIASRQGGDEFVLFLYEYESKEELIETIGELSYVQNNSFVQLKENLNVTLRFSYGYCLTNGCTDYSKLIKEADKKMYENKMNRKKGLI